MMSDDLSLFEAKCEGLSQNFSERAGVVIEVGPGIQACAYFSFILSALHGTLILSNRKMLNTDAMALIMVLSYLEAAYFFNAGISIEACNLKLP